MNSHRGGHINLFISQFWYATSSPNPSHCDVRLALSHPNGLLCVFCPTVRPVHSLLCFAHLVVFAIHIALEHRPPCHAYKYPALPCIFCLFPPNSPAKQQLRELSPALRVCCLSFATSRSLLRKTGLLIPDIQVCSAQEPASFLNYRVSWSTSSKDGSHPNPSRKCRAGQGIYCAWLTLLPRRCERDRELDSANQWSEQRWSAAGCASH